MRTSIYLTLLLASAGITQAQSNDVPRLPEVLVTEPRTLEEAPVGPYQQPEWTTARRFSTTRVYVQQPPWGMAVEQWWRGRFYRDGGYKHRLQEEFEIGLPHRFQVDLYENWVIEKGQPTKHDSFAGELRWALADWGKIPLNPTIYGEYKVVDKGPDVFEVKLLLGEQFAHRWHWGLNLAWEQEIHSPLTTEIAISQALSYSLIDQKLGVGIEMKWSHETEQWSRNDPSISFVIGPSVQWRPHPRWHVDVVPLFGVTPDSPKVEAYVIVGFDFGPGHDKESVRTPVSLKSQ